LIEEIELLNVDLWHAGRLGSQNDAEAAEAAPEEPPEAFRYQTPSPPADER
jgi:hypothetical protein